MVSDTVTTESVTNLPEFHSSLSNAASLAKLGGLIANGGELNGIRLIQNKSVLTEMVSEPVRKFDEYLCANTTFTRGGLAVVDHEPGVTKCPLDGFGTF